MKPYHVIFTLFFILAVSTFENVCVAHAQEQENRTDVYIHDARKVLVSSFIKNDTGADAFKDAFDSYTFWNIDRKIRDVTNPSLELEHVLRRLPTGMSPSNYLFGYVIWLEFEAKYDPIDLVKGRSF